MTVATDPLQYLRDALHEWAGSPTPSFHDHAGYRRAQEDVLSILDATSEDAQEEPCRQFLEDLKQVCAEAGYQDIAEEIGDFQRAVGG